MPPPLILHVFATFAVGGPQVRFAALANRFGPRWRHAIVAMDGNTRLPRAAVRRTLDVSFPTVAIRKGDTLANVRRFRRVLRQLRPDVLVTYNWGAIEWAIANALPLRAPCPHRGRLRAGGARPARSAAACWPRRLVLRRATVVLPSRTLWRIATEVWRLPSGHVRYIPNGIDLARFRGTPRGGATVLAGRGAGDRHASRRCGRRRTWPACCAPSAA